MRYPKIRRRYLKAQFKSTARQRTIWMLASLNRRFMYF